MPLAEISSVSLSQTTGFLQVFHALRGFVTLLKEGPGDRRWPTHIQVGRTTGQEWAASRGSSLLGPSVSTSPSAVKQTACTNDPACSRVRVQAAGRSHRRGPGVQAERLPALGATAFPCGSWRSGGLGDSSKLLLRARPDLPLPCRAARCWLFLFPSFLEGP